MLGRNVIQVAGLTRAARTSSTRLKVADEHAAKHPTLSTA